MKRIIIYLSLLCINCLFAVVIFEGYEYVKEKVPFSFTDKYYKFVGKEKFFNEYIREYGNVQQLDDVNCKLTDVTNGILHIDGMCKNKSNISCDVLNAKSNEKSSKILVCQIFHIIDNNYGYGLNHIYSYIIREKKIDGISISLTDNHNKKYVCKLSADYILELEEKFAKSGYEALFDGIKLKMEMEARTLPQPIGEGITLIGFKLGKKSFVSTIMVDEELYDMDYMNISSKQMAASIKENISNGDPFTQAIVQMCCNLRIKMVFKHIGTITKKEKTVVINPYSI